MRSIRVAFVAIVKYSEIKKTKKEIPYLSIDAVAGTDSLRTWITMFGSDIEAIAAKLAPDGEVYAEGTLKLKTDKDGDAFLHCNAEVLTPLFNVRFDPKPKKALPAKPKQEAKPLPDGRKHPPPKGEYAWHDNGGDKLPENLL